MKFEGCKKIINKLLLIRQEEKKTYGALLQYSSCSTSETFVAVENLIVWQHRMIDFDIDQLWYWKWLISTIIYMDNGHWRYLVNGRWRIYWILMVYRHIYPLLFLIPRSWLDTNPEFLIEQYPEVLVPDSNCWCSNIGPRYFSCYYYTAPQQSVIAIVCCTKQ